MKTLNAKKKKEWIINVVINSTAHPSMRINLTSSTKPKSNRVLNSGKRDERNRNKR